MNWSVKEDDLHVTGQPWGRKKLVSQGGRPSWSVKGEESSSSVMGEKQAGQSRRRNKLVSHGGETSW